MLDVGIAYGQDLNEVKEAVREAAGSLIADPDLGALVTDEPEVMGVEDLGESRTTVRVEAGTLPGRQATVERALRQCINEAFERRGILAGAGSGQSG